jgi:hypothetical protein
VGVDQSLFNLSMKMRVVDLLPPTPILSVTTSVPLLNLFDGEICQFTFEVYMSVCMYVCVIYECVYVCVYVCMCNI